MVFWRFFIPNAFGVKVSRVDAKAGQSHRDCVPKPRVARNELPWGMTPIENPNLNVVLSAEGISF